MARPLMKLDEDLILKLAQIHCTDEEIGLIAGCSVDTLHRRYADLIAKGKADGRLTLRRLQWQSAQKGSYAMMIWLGKQVLHQSERTEIVLSKIPNDVLAEEIKKRIEDERGAQPAIPELPSKNK